MSPPRRLRIPHEVAALVRGLHPVLKRKVRAGLEALLQDPCAGKALRNELQGLRSYRVGRFRIIYRLGDELEVVAFGPRGSIYAETYRQLHEPRARYLHGPAVPDTSPEQVMMLSHHRLEGGETGPAGSSVLPRLFGPLGHVPPAAFEAHYYHQQQGSAMAA